MSNLTSKDTGKEAPAEAGDMEGPNQGSQAGQTEASAELAARLDDDHASPDAVPDAVLEDLKTDYTARLDQQGAKYEAEVKDLKAMYEVGMKELEARLERLEHDPLAEPGTEITGKGLSSGERADVKKADGQPRRWRLPSDARLNLSVAVVGGVLSESADYIADGAAHHAFGIAGVALSVGAGIIGVIRENRKSKNDHRTED